MATVSLQWDGLLPKIETQSLSFVQKNPEWDGRGVVVGILDTGVSPGVFGLQETSHGLPKIIDVVDCSGSGDVVMGAKVVACNGVVSASGRNIKVNPSWKNPSGEYRVGIKKAYDLYPKDLRERVKERRRKIWSQKLKEVIYYIFIIIL